MIVLSSFRLTFANIPYVSKSRKQFSLAYGSENMLIGII